MANESDRSGMRAESGISAGAQAEAARLSGGADHLFSCGKWPEILRAEVESLLGAAVPGAFLRRARGDALFVSDAARKTPDTTALESELSKYFYTARVEKNLLHISPAPEKVRAFEAFSSPEITPFLRGFTAFRGRETDEGAAILFSEGIKLCAESSGAAAISAYEKRVRQRAALALRTGGGGGLFACARMIEYLARRISE